MAEVAQLLTRIRATRLREVGVLVALPCAVVLLSRLRTDASHPADSGAALAHGLVVCIAVLVVLVAHRASALVNVLIRREVVVVSWSSVVCISLVELIEDGSASFIVDVADLGHNLLLNQVIINSATYLLILIGTCLHIGGVLVVVVVLGVLIRGHAKVVDRVLLVVDDPGLLESLGQVHKPVPIVGIETVPSELPKLALGHFSSFFHLSSTQLNLGCIDGT